ncbi:MAG: glycosyltransferase family 2 protein [Deferribacteres bacterium]|nr:glycosyltransferase family 2 protein [candidate division KSB1 bacterium]MCB9501396.1 glycosyltransferase family 2 protein [Deferribacteres bacterium]
MKEQYVILIPAYNAEAHIDDLLNRISKFTDERIVIIVIDDGSFDNTVEIVKLHKTVNLLKHEYNKGKGDALKYGIKIILERYPRSTAVIFIDSDLQHEPEKIPQFINAYEQGRGDFIVGRREISLRKMPFARIISNLLTSCMLSLKLKQKIYDSQCGYRLVSLFYLQNDVTFQMGNYAFETELLIKAGKKGAKFFHIDIPTIYHGSQSYIHGLRDTLAFIKTFLRY